MHPQPSSRTTVVKRPITLTELKTLVEVLPPSQVMKDVDGKDIAWRNVEIEVFGHPGKGWEVSTILVTRENLFSDRSDDEVIFSSTTLHTQRRKDKVYKRLDTLVADMRDVFGERSYIVLIL